MRLNNSNFIMDTIVDPPEMVRNSSVVRIYFRICVV
jgi:hypothetical protein